MIGQSLSYTRHTHTELNMFKSQNDKSGFLCHRRDSPACGELRAVGEERRGEGRGRIISQPGLLPPDLPPPGLSSIKRSARRPRGEHARAVRKRGDFHIPVTGARNTLHS